MFYRANHHGTYFGQSPREDMSIQKDDVMLILEYRGDNEECLVLCRHGIYETFTPNSVRLRWSKL